MRAWRHFPKSAVRNSRIGSRQVPPRLVDAPGAHRYKRTRANVSAILRHAPHHRRSQRKGKSEAMANKASAKKAIRKIARRTEVNRSRRSRMRTFLRRVEDAIAQGDQDAAAEALRNAEPQVMRSARKGLIHENAAARTISRLSRRVKVMTA